MDTLNTVTTWRHQIEFSTSTDAEAKALGESIKSTTVVVFQDWTLEDLLEYAATTVKINQIQPKLRKGEVIGAEFIASRPGTKPAKAEMTPLKRLINAIGVERAEKAVNKYGSAEKAIEAMKALFDDEDDE